MKIKLLSISTLLLVGAFTMTANASTVTLGYTDYEDGAGGARDLLASWETANSFVADTILEDFEGFAPLTVLGAATAGNPQDVGVSSLTTANIGDFTNGPGAAGGGGSMSFSNTRNFGVVERDVLPGDIPGTQGNSGRTSNWNVTNSFFGTQYLESGDIPEINLNSTLEAKNLDNLFFYMFDVADFGTMTVTLSDDSFTSFDILKRRDDGEIVFVGITADAGKTIKAINWDVGYSGDGYGMDNFGTASLVPLPASVILLGTGLAGLIGTRMRRKKYWQKN